MRQLEELETKRKKGILNPRERVNLGACLIRLGRYSKAQEVLEESLRMVPRDSSYRFLLQLNLAAVCQEDNSLLQRALDLQREALDAWPALLPSWNRQESSWFRHVERYALTVMELRNREQILRGGRPIREQLPPDLLFPREERDLSKKVQFIGDSNAYEAGGIAWKQWERLPADADRVVLQLLFWRPHDPRLLWLHGELLNARGQIDWAYYAMYNVRENYQWRNRELDQHFRALDAAVKPYRVLFADKTQSGENLRAQALLLWQLMPRGAMLAPGTAAAASEIGGVTASTFAGALSGGRQPPERDQTRGADAPRSGTILPDWRHLTVSFLTGMVVAVLAVLQWQQWRRHRRIVTTDEEIIVPRS